MQLFPRLLRHDAERRFDEIRDAPLSELLPNLQSLPDCVRFAATGGQRVSLSGLHQIRNRIHAIAAESGFPERTGDGEKAEFDAQCSLWLLRESGIAPGEAFRDGVWAFLTIELLADVAAWRFPARNRRRFLGGVRNTFQRLWHRAFLLNHGHNRELLAVALRRLQEDAFLQLVERPGSSANPYVASRIAAAWMRAADREDFKPIEGVHRSVMKELTQLGAVRNIDSLGRKNLDALLDDLYLEFGRKT